MHQWLLMNRENAVAYGPIRDDADHPEPSANAWAVANEFTDLLPFLTRERTCCGREDGTEGGHAEREGMPLCSRCECFRRLIHRSSPFRSVKDGNRFVEFGSLARVFGDVTDRGITHTVAITVFTQEDDSFRFRREPQHIATVWGRRPIGMCRCTHPLSVHPGLNHPVPHRISPARFWANPLPSDERGYGPNARGRVVNTPTSTSPHLCRIPPGCRTPPQTLGL